MNKPQQALHTVFKAACASAAVIGLVAANVAHAADAGNGKVLAGNHNCAACHGANLNNPVSPEYPKLAGQHSDYVYWALRQYQMGNGNPHLGRNNAIMQAQVQSLSPSDMKDIAAYIESLDGGLVQKK
ncbi:Cytochrome c4 [Paraburkholderia domus]|jgi:cytochrome c553|uniref:Cytochrome c4 n=1 Tax=Paraburkholderia domus TaxID=2793075 RepID=A0A9N8QYF7_9BURK|nr:c-type cytochrome [Paraburkholderia domus]MBK5049694.1 c-type cytochrome [Burkholderia sp. R-70006]MBK5059870.1 c-type cytochrome [Burkholderia sp. R-70199]MBK5087540.1 c-type cytochrome [Burkholderia sp. R-69927]MBK5121690.1 c-type cytochrome [Burkholderia sp. R-69980]MBK5167332.1 c-type cytochrome [Burkholderia sp. R-70211]MBK5181033.1 c-type cytochrome [Burkholderia sp. R-69749]MCI0145892.1 c-type cytochrome [Paraburkholderia sediminicola]